MFGEGNAPLILQLFLQALRRAAGYTVFLNAHCFQQVVHCKAANALVSNCHFKLET